MRGLRADLGRVQAYAALCGILVGAGIFRVTGDAWVLTGSSVIVAYAVLAIPLIATAVPYMAFLAEDSEATPAGEYNHLRRVGSDPRLATWVAWLKIVSYVGALAFLSEALVDYVLTLLPESAAAWDRMLAEAVLTLVIAVHIAGVRWFGRIQVAMFSTLLVSLVVLIVPGVFAIEWANYAPVWKGGAAGFVRALVPLFFAYAGFEAVSHAAAEVRGGKRVLPRVMLGGILATTAIFVAMSSVAFGVVDGATLAGSGAPMHSAAAAYLPAWGAAVVTIGAVMALATSLNVTALVPARLLLVLAHERRAPAWLARLNPRTGAPVSGLIASWAFASALMQSGQLQLALRVAVIALMIVYLIHSAAAWRLRSPTIPRPVLRSASLVSITCLGAMVLVQFGLDLQTIFSTTFTDRWGGGGMTSLELLAVWSGIGLLLLRPRKP